MTEPRLTAFMREYLKGLERFNAALDPPFRDMALLREVFTHSSFLNEVPAGAGEFSSNERLEFLGDAVLGAAISHLLFKRYAATQEGGLTLLRARLVNRRVLADLARKLGLERHILMGRGLAASGGASNERILAGLFEAYIGGRYLEEGFDATLLRVERLFGPMMEEVGAEPGYFDYKPGLQELTQRLFREMPRYVLAKSSGAPHEKTYTVEVIVKGEVLGRGRGRSKKEAEQAAAREAMERLEGAGAGKGKKTGGKQSVSAGAEHAGSVGTGGKAAAETAAHKNPAEDKDRKRAGTKRGRAARAHEKARKK